jgi:hypothetical protein
MNVRFMICVHITNSWWLVTNHGHKYEKRIHGSTLKSRVSYHFMCMSRQETGLKFCDRHLVLLSRRVYCC